MLYRISLAALICFTTWVAHVNSAHAGKECDAHAWIRLPPEGMFSEAMILSSERIVPLSEKMKDLATVKLREASMYRLGADELEALGAKDLPHGRQAFFVRGVAFNVKNGSWTLKLADDMLSVGHDSLGPATLSLRCEPILIFLEHAPRSVFVRAGIDR